MNASITNLQILSEDNLKKIALSNMILPSIGVDQDWWSESGLRDEGGIDVVTKISLPAVGTKRFLEEGGGW